MMTDTLSPWLSVKPHPIGGLEVLYRLNFGSRFETSVKSKTRTYCGGEWGMIRGVGAVGERGGKEVVETSCVGADGICREEKGWGKRGRGIRGILQWSAGMHRCILWPNSCPSLSHLVIACGSDEAPVQAP
jgi:hypothetical protein